MSVKDFLEPKVTNSPKSKDIQFTIYDNEKQPILPLKKLEPSNVIVEKWLLQQIDNQNSCQ